MKRQAIFDEEKRARMEEMRRTGIPIKRANEIPFGVRALQRGVEVDGIWISRSDSPHETTARATPLVAVIDLDPDKIVEYSADLGPVPVSTSESEQPPQKHCPPIGTKSQRLEDVESTDGGRQAAPPVSPSPLQPRRQGYHAASVLNEDTLRRLEGQSFLKPSYDTYVPAPSPRNPRRPSQRSSVSSSGESMDSQPRSMRSASGRSYTSSRSSRLYMARNVHESRFGYGAGAHGWQGDENRDPFGTPHVVPTPARTPSGFSYNDPHSMQQQERLAHEPTFGLGDLHLNRTTRRVNGGFEVLPAGTFGVLHEYEGNAGGSDADVDDNLAGRSVRATKSSNKLRKKSNGQLQDDGLT